MRPMILVALCLSLSGCIMPNIGSARYPEPPSGYMPRTAYPVPAARLWTAVSATLQAEGIPVATSDRAQWRLTTEGVEGETRMAIGILGAASFTTRYRLTIVISPAGRSSTLTVTAIIESSEEGQGQWLNVTRDYPSQATGIEQWFRSRVEAQLGQ